jgi:hypothetical protein
MCEQIELSGRENNFVVVNQDTSSVAIEGDPA